MKDKGVREYQMSNKIGYWFEKGKLEKDKFNKVQLVGKLKDKSWHFGISGAGKLYPFPVLMIFIPHLFHTRWKNTNRNTKHTAFSTEKAR